jgi:hypothetical protein
MSLRIIDHGHNGWALVLVFNTGKAIFLHLN